MIHPFVTIIRVVAAIGCFSSFIYYVACLWSAAEFLREKQYDSDNSLQELPPVSILKPLKGTDPEITECLRSHCLQKYSEYEIIFGVGEADDPAVASVRQLQSEFPAAGIQLVVCPQILGANRKVSNLAQMLPHASHSHLVVNDSDIRVGPDYLRQIITPLLQPNIGMVTSLYRGHTAQTCGSRLESVGISSDFCAGVLVAKLLEGGLHFALGSTMAFRREDLQRMGGFESIADYLADDYELGKRIADLGLQVRLSRDVVETFLPAYDLAGFWAHQLRWGRGMRNSRPGGYLGLIFTFGMLWSLLCVAVSFDSLWAWEVGGAVIAARILVAAFLDKAVLRNRSFLQNLWLLPLHDLLAAGVWLSSFTGNMVSWRGDRFRIENGKLVRVATNSSN